MDLIELGIAEIKATLADKKIVPKNNAISVIRRKLAEFVAQGCNANVEQPGKKSKVLKDIHAALTHFKKAAFDTHSLSIDCDLNAAKPPKKDDVEEIEEDDDDVQQVSFVLSVPMKTMTLIQSGDS